MKRKKKSIQEMKIPLRLEGKKQLNRTHSLVVTRKKSDSWFLVSKSYKSAVHPRDEVWVPVLWSVKGTWVWDWMRTKRPGAGVGRLICPAVLSLLFCPHTAFPLLLAHSSFGPNLSYTIWVWLTLSAPEDFNTLIVRERTSFSSLSAVSSCLWRFSVSLFSPWNH